MTETPEQIAARIIQQALADSMGTNEDVARDIAAALRAERARAEEAEATSEARRRTLFEKSDALRLEGLRADNAEARAEQAEAELARLKPAPLTPDQARGIALLTDFQRDKRAFYSEERAAFAAVLALLDGTR